MKSFIVYNIFICLFFLLTRLHSSNILYLASCTQSYDLTHYLKYYIDKSGRLTYNEVKNKKFIKNSKTSINFGFTPYTYWFSISVFPKINNKWILEIGYPPLDSVSIFVNDKLLYESGDSYPFYTRDIKTPTYSCYLNLKLNKINSLYIKVQTSSSLQFPIKIYPERIFFNKKSEINLIQGIYIGILAVMIFYNFFIFITVKDITYLVYIAYVISVLFFYLTISGLTFKYIFPDNTFLNNRALPFSVNSISFFGTFFGIIFLNIKQHNKMLHYLLIVLCAVVGILMFTSMFFSYSIEIQVSAIIAMILSILLLFSGVLTLFKGYKPALYYVIGWSTLLIGVVILVMNKFGIIPQNIFTNNVLSLGSVIEVIFLSISLGARINDLQEKRRQAELKYLREQAAMAEASTRFVPAQFLKFLDKKSLMNVNLGDSVEKNMTILFSDIRDFTTLSESMNVNDNFAFVNSYFKKMNPIIHRNKGFIDKFIGDSIMALFPYNCDDAIIASIEMYQILKDYNYSRRNRGFEPIDIGIGLNYGKIMLGTVGSNIRLSTTVIGDAVNIASRIEALTKFYKSKILISENVYNNLSNLNRFYIREIDAVKLKGKSQHIKIYEVFNIDNEILIEKKLNFMSSFLEGVRLYREKNFKKALNIFEEIKKKVPEDSVIDFYIKKIKRDNVNLSQSPL